MTAAAPTDLTQAMDQSWLMKRAKRGIFNQVALAFITLALVSGAIAIIGEVTNLMLGLLVTILVVELAVTITNVHFWWGTYKLAKLRLDYFDARDDLARAISGDQDAG